MIYFKRDTGLKLFFKIKSITTQINNKALKARHKKLKTNKYSQKNLFLGFFSAKRKKKIKLKEEKVSHNTDLTKMFHLAASRFAFKASLFSVSFLLFYSLLPSYSSYANYDEGFLYASSNYEASDFTMAEDGFLLKPSIMTEKSDRTQFTNAITYDVQPGDTLSEIASQFEIKTSTILENNTIPNPNSLKTGMSLTILPVDGVLHKIKKGETTASIALTYKVKKEALVAQNKIENDEVTEGKTIIVPGGHKIVPRYIVSRNEATRYSGAGYGTLSNTEYTGDVSSNIIKPAAGSITQYYRRGHYAIDIGNRNKGPILAAANGVIIKAQGGYNGGYGNMIIVDHGNGRQTLYAHNSALYVKVGDAVTQGQTIAWMGNTGRVYGPTGIHLHFELRVNGRKLNPLLYIK